MCKKGSVIVSQSPGLQRTLYWISTQVREAGTKDDAQSTKTLLMEAILYPIYKFIFILKMSPKLVPGDVRKPI